LLGGHIQAMFNNPISALPFIKSGKLRALASTGPKRSVSAPEIPTVAELGFPNYEVGTWFALLGPKGMPLSIVNKISNDTAEQLKKLEVIVKMNTEGIEPWIRSSSELSQILVQDQAKWGQIIKEAHIKLD
jgi:tripartite-type tricarboxylate transporter receptor subunit TctC